jgi:hypothetical protein
MLIRRMITVVAAALPVTLIGAGTGSAEPVRAEESQQLLFYNHAYAVLDSETADAIENSEYLREFANFEIRTTTGGNLTWTGRYLYGAETYLEFFEEGTLPAPDDTTSAAGLAVSADHDGDLATVIERLPAAGLPDPLPFLQTRDFGDGVRVPWFDGVNTVATYDGFGAWGMEYREEYFADPRSKTEPASYAGDTSRERYLPDTYQDHLMKNVTGITIAVTENDLANNLPLLKAGGFSVRSLSGGGAVASGDSTTIVFEVVPLAEAGVQKITFQLNRTITYQDEVQLGSSTLLVGPRDRAVWTFE